MSPPQELDAAAIHHEPHAYDDPTDLEKKTSPNDAPPENDPFGNEECGEVQYRVMKWWYVSLPTLCFLLPCWTAI